MLFHACLNEFFLEELGLFKRSWLLFSESVEEYEFSDLWEGYPLGFSYLCKGFLI